MVDELERDLLEELKDPDFALSYGEECAKSDFGLALFHVRQKAKMTQQELADKLGYSQPYIAQLESGEVNPTLGAVGKMLAALNLKMVIDTERLVPSKPSHNVVVYLDSGNSVIAAQGATYVGTTQGSVYTVTGITGIYPDFKSAGEMLTPAAIPAKSQAIAEEPELVLAA